MAALDYTITKHRKWSSPEGNLRHVVADVVIDDGDDAAGGTALSAEDYKKLGFRAIHHAYIGGAGFYDATALVLIPARFVPESGSTNGKFQFFFSTNGAGHDDVGAAQVTANGATARVEFVGV